ncbi:MAG: hypothetical protein LAT67_05430 [Balneolales bacterium]|nr:hypothetical protein [Balneolales bacterium]
MYTSETEYSTNEAIDFSVHNKTDDVLKVFRSTSVYGDAFVEFVIQQKVGENDWEIVLNPLYHGIYVPAIYLEPAERETFSLYIQSRGEFQWEKGEVYRIMLTILKPSDSMRGWDSLDEELVVSNPFLMK